MTRFKNLTSEEILLRVSLCLMILYPLLTAFQGLDFTDFGFLAVKYRDVFKVGTLDSGVDGVWPLASFYLTEVLAGTWHLVFGGLGALGFKLGFVVLAWLTQFVVWLGLKKVVRPAILIPGLLLATLAITPEMQWINYNNTSALGFTLAGVFLFRSLRESAGWLDYFLSGFFLVLTIFFRLPNIVGILLLVLPLALVWRRSGWRDCLTRASQLGAGLVAGLGLMLLLILALGHGPTFVSGLKSLLGSNPGESHQLSHLVKRLLADSAKVAGVVLALWAAFAFAARFEFKRSFTLFIPTILIVFLIHLPMYLAELQYGKTLITWSLYILGVVVFLAIKIFLDLPKPRLARPELWQVGLVLGIAFLIPQGSDRGLWNSVYGLWLAIPLVLGLSFGQGGWAGKDQSVRRRGLAVLILPTAILALLFASSFVYRDLPFRWELTASLSSPKLRGILTNEPRARLVNELTAKLAEYDLVDQPLLAYPGIPLLLYACESRPYLSFAWPSLLPIELQEEAFNRARVEYPGFPLIVRARLATSGRHWPEPDPGVKVISRGQDRRENLERLARDLMRAGEYRLVWTNPAFEIWEPGRAGD